MNFLRRHLPFALTLCTVVPVAIRADERGVAAVELSETDWPNWRGPFRNGVAHPKQRPPTEWSETKNVVWKAELPGRGHGSPIVVGNQVVVATAEMDTQLQSVVCLNRKTGERLWKTVVHRGSLSTKGNKKSTQASTTLAWDGQRFYVNFLNNRAVHTTALDGDGKEVWRTKITDYVVHQGYGSSPAIWKGLVIVSADNKGGGAIAGLRRGDGEIVWRNERPKKPNYASPVLLEVAGKTQALFTGCDLVTSLSPETGEKIWEIKGSTTECVTSLVSDGQLVFTSGGYPRNHVSAVRGDGSGEVVWQNTTRVYVPSMLVHDGHLYAVADSGVAVCWRCEDGKEMWKRRVGGVFTSSPVLVGERIYATNEGGKSFVFKADPDKFQLIAENQLGDEVYATPAICDSRIYARVVTKRGGQTKEMLYCLGNAPR